MFHQGLSKVWFGEDTIAWEIRIKLWSELEFSFMKWGHLKLFTTTDNSFCFEGNAVVWRPTRTFWKYIESLGNWKSEVTNQKELGWCRIKADSKNKTEILSSHNFRWEAHILIDLDHVKDCTWMQGSRNNFRCFHPRLQCILPFSAGCFLELNF